MLLRVLFSICGIAAAAAGAPFSSLYFFGDSLTDTGNVLEATTALRGYTLGMIPKHPTAPYDGGRFTNGQVWAEHVAARLDHPGSAAPAGMSMGAFGQVGGPGNNYAVGGARTDESGALGLLNYFLPTGMSRQVDFYLSRSGGVADAEALYFLLGGGNDLREASRIADATERMLAAQEAGANIAYSVRDLYSAGARQFVLINSPDIGLIPEIMGDGLTKEGTDAAVQFNTWFGSYGDYLRNSVPGFSLHYFDLFGLHHELVDQYGMGAVRPCKSQPESCAETLFFDSVHPTAWVHEIIGNRVADHILSADAQRSSSFASAGIQTPEPSTGILAMSALTLVVLVGRGRSRRMPETRRNQLASGQAPAALIERIR